jgi:hypothetical protein
MKHSILTPGLGGLLSFTVFLKKEGVTYSIHQYDDESLTVFFSTIGARFEVDFYEKYVTYSHFKGSEESLDDEIAFMRLFREGWDMKA